MSTLIFFRQMILKDFFWIWRSFKWLSHKILLADNPLLPKFYIFEMVSPINLLLQKHERQNTSINCTKKCLEGTGEKLEKYGIKKHYQTKMKEGRKRRCVCVYVCVKWGAGGGKRFLFEAPSLFFSFKGIWLKSCP